MTASSARLDGAAACLVVLAAVSAALAAPAGLRAPLAVLAAAAVVARTAPLRRRGPADAVLVGAGGLLVAAVLLGLVLNVVPGGISRVSEAVGSGVLGLVALAAAAGWRRRTMRAGTDRDRLPGPRTDARTSRPGLATVTMLATAALVVAVALTVSVRATDASQGAPLSLALTGDTTGATTAPAAGITVSVTGGAPGPYRLTVTAGRDTRVLGGDFVIAPGATVTRTVPAPAQRSTVTLRDATTGRVLRTAIVGGTP